MSTSSVLESPPLLGLGLKVLGMGKLDERYSIFTNIIHPQPFFQFHLITEGQCVLQEENGIVHTIEAGNVFMLLPNTTYTPVSGDQNWKGYWVYFDGTLVRDLDAQKTFGENFSMKQCKNIEALVNNWERCLGIVDDGIAAEATSLIYNMLSINYSAPKRKDSPRINKILEAIDADPIKDWDFEIFAKEQSISYSRLRQTFREYVGSPPATYLRQKRMHYAAQLMIEGKSSKETCYAIGMEDPYHFSRLFKQVMGESPRKWLKNWLSE